LIFSPYFSFLVRALD